MSTAADSAGEDPLRERLRSAVLESEAHQARQVQQEVQRSRRPAPGPVPGSRADSGPPLPPPWLDQPQPGPPARVRSEDRVRPDRPDQREQQDRSPVRSRRPGRSSSSPVSEAPPADEADWGRPISLDPEQLGGEAVVRGRAGIAVWAWLPHTDGRFHKVACWAGEWTSSAVHVRWRSYTGEWSAWCHASDITRRQVNRIQGLPATMRPGQSARIDPRRRPGPE